MLLSELVKRIEWNTEKSQILVETRKLDFKIFAEIITNEREKIVAVINHPNIERYPTQRIFLINVDNYIYLVPFVEDEEKIFLKTVIPSNKYTRDYLINKKK